MAGIQLVGTGGVVAFELIEDVRQRIEGFSRKVACVQRRRTVYLIKSLWISCGIRISRVVSIKLLGNELVAEDRFQLIRLKRF